MSKWKWWAIGATVGLVVLFVAVVWLLYRAGDADQSTLERFRDIAVILIVLSSVIIVVLLAAITATLGFLAFQVKDRLIPLMEELTGTARRIRGTAEFMSEEAVKPIVTIAGAYAKTRATVKTVLRRNST